MKFATIAKQSSAMVLGSGILATRNPTAKFSVEGKSPLRVNASKLIRTWLSHAIPYRPRLILLSVLQVHFAADREPIGLGKVYITPANHHRWLRSHRLDNSQVSDAWAGRGEGVHFAAGDLR
jgi:hypothetical protein